MWSFGSNVDPNPDKNREATARVLRAAPALPDSKITNVPQYLIALQPGQPVMVNLPQIGTVPMTLTKPRGSLAWEATDSSGAKHRISAQWIFPSF